MRRIHALLVSCLFALVGCPGGLDPSPRLNYGIIGLNASVSGDGVYRLSPIGLFFRSIEGTLPTSRVTSDLCELRPFPDRVGGNAARFLDAGDSLELVTGLETAYLYRVFDPDQPRYETPSAATVRATPGSAVSLNIPGATDGFPSASISAKTAEPFTLDPIEPAPGLGQGLLIAWSPVGDDSSKVLVSAQYGIGSDEATAQIFCSFVDDGSVTIPPQYVTGWRDAPAASRRVEAARWRVSRRDLGESQLAAISTFAVTKVEFP